MQEFSSIAYLLKKKGIISEDQLKYAERINSKLPSSRPLLSILEVTSIHEAVIRLGGEQVADLAIMAAQKNRYRASSPKINSIMKRLWQGSVASGMTTKWIAKKINSAGKGNAFLAGLIHDIGQLFILTVIDMLKTEKKFMIPLSDEIIKETAEVLHEEKGRELLEHWNMPSVYRAIAGNHHADRFDEENILLVMVRLSDCACRKLGIGLTSDPTITLSVTEEARILGLSEITLAEMEIVIEDTLILV